MTKFTFVVPVSDKNIYRNNFFDSPALKNNEHHEIIVLEDNISATVAYNNGIRRANNDIIVFAHQDMWFPKNWIENLNKNIDDLKINHKSWGVLGCYGVTKEGKRWGYLYDTGLGKILGHPFKTPMEIQTLDEIVLIINKEENLQFDENLPDFHLYGTDICMKAKEKGLKCYAISNFCIHNTNQYVYLPREFYNSFCYMKKRWKKYLPIYTTCIVIDKFGKDMYRRKLLALYTKIFKRKIAPRYRVQNPESIFRQLEL